MLAISRKTRPAAGLLLAISLLGALLAGCTAVQRVPDTSKRTALRLKVTPKSTELYVDGDYRGKVKGWVDGLVPMTPGDHRVKLQAKGYIPRRFDVHFKPGELKVLTLQMEPTL